MVTELTYLRLAPKCAPPQECTEPNNVDGSTGTVKKTIVTVPFNADVSNLLII